MATGAQEPWRLQVKAEAEVFSHLSVARTVVIFEPGLVAGLRRPVGTDTNSGLLSFVSSIIMVITFSADSLAT
jgi:hypothetical protein